MQAFRILRAVVATTLLLSLNLPPARAAPTDPFAAAADGTAMPSNGATALERPGPDGSFSYDLPIAVPPGHNGLAPALRLHYTSGGALRGGIAVGWSLPLPVIEQDLALPDRVAYTADLGAGPVKLVPVSDPELTGQQYRAEDDADQARFEQFIEAMPALGSWAAALPTGRHLQFIETSNAPYAAHQWRIQRELDRDGNRIDYHWTKQILGAYSEQVLSSIEYGANAAAGVVSHAKVEFLYAPVETCAGGLVPIGAELDQRGSQGELHGARRLQTIVTSVRDTPTGAWRVVRRVTLRYDGYELSCSNSHAPLRYLTGVTEEAYSPTGVAIALPTQAFSYGPTAPTWSEARDLGAVGGGGVDAGWRMGATQMVRDMDGDGLPDLVRIDTDATGCTLHTRRGTYGGGFVAADIVTPVPSIDWATPGAPEGEETCTLGGQFARRDVTGSYSSCGTNLAQVSYNFVDWNGDGVVDLLTDLWMTNWTEQVAGGDFVPRIAHADSAPSGPTDAQRIECGESGGTIDGNVCVCGQGTVAAPTAAPGSNCQPTYWGNGGGGPGEPQPGTPDPTPPTGGTGPSCAFGMPTPESDHVGVFTWRLFPGTGAGEFDGDLQYIDAPVPLPTGRPETAVAESLGRPNLPHLLDVDGDGRVDLVSPPILWDGSPALPVVDRAFGRFDTLMVWRNLGDDGLPPPPPPGSGQPWGTPWSVPIYGQSFTTPTGTTTSGTPYPHHFSNTQELTVADWNGDGRVDIVGNDATTHALVASWNHGAGFGTPAAINGAGPLLAWTADLPQYLSDRPYSDGVRIATRQVFDVDADGLPDVLDTTPATGDVSTMAATAVRINQGGWLGPSIPANAALWLANQQLRAANESWDHTHTALDVTGDGVVDLIDYGADGHLHIRTEPANQPLRLLRAIDNGRGAVTRVDYAPSTDPSVVDTSTQALPFVRWVVRGITVEPGAGQPAMTSSFSYALPRWFNTQPGTHDPRTFVGFAKMTTDVATTAAAAEQARTIATFSYVGGSLRPVSEWVYGSTGAGFTVPLRHTQHTWITAPLYAGAARFTYQSATVEHHCAVGATEASCLADVAGTRAQAVQYDPVRGADGRPRAYLRALATTAIDATRARRESTQYRVDLSYAHYGFDLIRAQTDAAQSTTTVFGIVTTLTPMARTRYDLDTRGHPLNTWVSTADGVELLTVRSFDLAGNVTSERKPSQLTATTQVTYDAFLLTPVSRTNELGQVVKTQHDLGTGALVRREGPSSRTYAPCTGCADVTTYAPETWTIDGAGRVLSHAVAADPATGGGYATVVTDEHAYDDLARPTTVTHRTKVDWAGTLIGTTEARQDGLGRLVGQTAPGIVYAANVISYHYDAAGNVAAIDRQDPRRDTASYVTTTYQHDALGRPTRETRPDGTAAVTTYDRDDSLVTETSPIDGTGARTRYMHDRLGRLVTVDQYDLPTVGQHALTQTSYDELDRPLAIVDADGTTTTLSHDWAGRRTAISRGARTWQFGYDADGNLTSRQAPLPTPMTDPALYTSRWTYDALGRVLTHTTATRGMSAPRLTELGLGTTTYTYDTDANGVGQLAKVILPRGIVDYRYDVHGQLWWEQRQLTMAAGTGIVTPRHSVFRVHTIDGQLASEKWEDGSQWQITYDTRGLSSRVLWLDPATNRWVAVSSTPRSVVGLPRSRDAATYDQRRTYQYDVMGRVTSDRIWKVSTNATFGERTYGYDGLGELRAVGGTIDGQLADATFDYDAGHRLLTATGPMAYTASFTYTGAGNVTRATVVGGDTGTRDVRYQYGLRDPQAADALLDYATGAQRATFSYDPSGNAVQRVNASGTYDQTWDGDDALREVAGPAGTERYYYDHTGARIGAVGPDGVKFWFGSTETHYTTAGAQTARWLHLSAGEPIARVENKTALEFQYADALQNLILTASPSGTITGSFLYGAFGEVVASRGAASHRRQFNGKENDLASGLRYYGARYYDPLLMRWISADPLYQAVPELAKLEPQRGNWYAFSVNNPVRYYDPDGKDAGCQGWLACTLTPPQAETSTTVKAGGRVKFEGGNGKPSIGVTVEAEQETRGPYTFTPISVRGTLGADGAAVEIDPIGTHKVALTDGVSVKASPVKISIGTDTKVVVGYVEAKVSPADGIDVSVSSSWGVQSPVGISSDGLRIGLPFGWTPSIKIDISFAPLSESPAVKAMAGTPLRAVPGFAAAYQSMAAAATTAAMREQRTWAH